ncbi:MAG: bifunctional oligoribonuclease/PAP phosphatase NrnA [Mollicutes bacterium]|jgi:phosphoesterase RecJ-like protein|nr:bifunctional oligoribonuclease/PAP phosphatase NrnA [Mollicutes bacterium]
MKKVLKKIYRQIKKYDTIVIARHIGPDPDALASQIALRDIILNTFPKKKVYTVGCPASKFKYLGTLDKFNEEMYYNSLLIAVDVPDKARVDGIDPDRFSNSIKIDHHPYVETFCKLEWIDPTASSSSQMIVELALNTKLRITKEAAEKLFMGIVADTNRFMFYYTTPKTFDLVSMLIKKTNIDFTNLYENLYFRPLKEVKFQGYIANNFTITENGLAYILLTEDILNQFNVDAATAGNMVNEFNYVEEIITWAVFSVDKINDTIRGSIRSRGPIINGIAAHFGGGGHDYASGVRLKNEEEITEIVKMLDAACLEYRQKQTNE